MYHIQTASLKSASAGIIRDPSANYKFASPHIKRLLAFLSFTDSDKSVI